MERVGYLKIMPFYNRWFIILHNDEGWGYEYNLTKTKYKKFDKFIVNDGIKYRYRQDVHGRDGFKRIIALDRQNFEKVMFYLRTHFNNGRMYLGKCYYDFYAEMNAGR